MPPSELEYGRAEELETLLLLLQPRLVQHVAQADPNSDRYRENSLGTYISPQELKEKLHGDGIEARFEDGIKGDNDKVMEEVDKVLQHSVNTWNPGFLDKLYASTNPIGVVSDLILSMLNTNSHVYTVSPVLSVLENYVARKYARMFFGEESSTCGGLTFAGGLWSNVTSLHMARAIKHPSTKVDGNGSTKFAVFSSRHCHYSVEKAAILLGLGSTSVFKVDITEDGAMKADDLEFQIKTSIEKGYTPLYINATAGTTVFGSFDPFGPIAAVAKKFDCWFHIDGSWGGNVVFSPTHRHKLNGCQLADSITVNPHKMLGVPTTCSFLLVPHVSDFQRSMSLSAPYLFHGREDEGSENFDLADGTMGCGRRADSFKFYMAWLYYGTNGLRKRVDHAFAICKYFKSKADADSRFELVVENPQCLQVCFYYCPQHYKDHDRTAVTRYISRELHRRGRYLVDFSPNANGDPRGEFFRVVFNSPIVDEAVVDDLVKCIVDVGHEYNLN